MKADVAVIGGGPAGLAAAIEAKKNGAQRVVIFERDIELGGILNQCIHAGFGLHRFGEELTGPEYAARFISQVNALGIEVKLNTMVLSVEGKRVCAVSPLDGYFETDASAVVLAMGCRERTRGAILIPGDRPAGVLTAGSAQRYVNLEGQMVGKRVIILGSGDIGLIMARRMTLEGAKVVACVEVLPYSGGLARNIAQCLHDFDIPLYLSHTITNIIGDRRVEKVIVSKVDENRKPIPGSEMEFKVDTVLLSVGLIPENELTREAKIEIDSHTSGAVCYENMETTEDGVFACGNVLHVHDLVDYVSEESAKAGAAAAAYVAGDRQDGQALGILNGDGVSYTVPQRVRRANVKKSLEVFFRVRRVFGESRIELKCGENKIASFKRERMAPGEMERILLPKAILESAEGDITVSVSEAET